MGDIQATLHKFLRAFSKLQFDEMTSFFTDDATAFFPIKHQHLRLVGKKAISDAFSHVLARVRGSGVTQIRLDAEDVHVQEFNHVAIVTFHIRDVSLSRRTLVLRSTGGRWQIEHLHGSNAPLSRKQTEAQS